MQDESWVERLQSDDELRDQALAELREYLLRGLSRSLKRRGGGEAFAEDVVQQALVKILNSIETFEGRSRFTTWAMTIASRIGISELRRRHFKDVSLDQISGPDDMKIELAIDSESSPESKSDRDEILKQLRRLIENYLTEKQRTVVQAALSGMPMEEIARRLDSNRNAIYKLFHDARKKLRAGFEAEGIAAADIQAVLA